jgi:hypothetical protein
LLISHTETPIRGKNADQVYLRYRTLNGVRITGTQRQLNVQNQPIDSYEFIAQDLVTHITSYKPGNNLDINLKYPDPVPKLSAKCYQKVVGDTFTEELRENDG